MGVDEGEGEDDGEDEGEAEEDGKEKGRRGGLVQKRRLFNSYPWSFPGPLTSGREACTLVRSGQRCRGSNRAAAAEASYQPWPWQHEAQENSSVLESCIFFFLTTLKTLLVR